MKPVKLLFSLIALSWILLIFFSFLIAFIINIFSNYTGLLWRILDVVIGAFMLLLWIFIWYKITFKIFDKKLNEYKNKS